MSSTSYLASQTGPSSYSQETVANGKSNAIQLNVEQFAKENDRVLDRVSANLELNQVHENTGLLCQVRENICYIFNNLTLSDVIEVEKNMPPFPVKPKI